MAALCIQVPDCIWTKALFDGSVEVEGFDVACEAAPFDHRTSRRLRGEVEEKYSGTEQVLTDYIVRVARGTEKELVALPIFVTRGMVHRKFVMRRGTLAPKDLKGRVVGMGRVLGATSVYLRGVLEDEYGVGRSDARWVAAEPLTSDGAMGQEWKYLHERGGIKASELLQRLDAGELDAVIYPGGAGGHWFNWLAESGASRTPDPYGDLEQMVAASSNLSFPIGDPAAQVAWFKKTGIYPTYHCLAVRKSLRENSRGLAAALVHAFDRAAKEAPRYMNAAERRLYEREQEILGVDPNACGLNEIHKRTVEKCIDILVSDGLLTRRVTAEEVFPYSAA
jgi:4,5-dihydroxyphthalate decarboxylase